MSAIPEIPRGHARKFKLCKLHGQVGFMDYVPYSLSVPIEIMPCGCSAKNAEYITEQEFNHHIAALDPDPLAIAREICAILDCHSDGDGCFEDPFELANDLEKASIHEKLTNAIAKATGHD
jgi:hypothetical protein